MTIFVRILLIVVAVVVIVGAGTVLINVLRTDLVWPAKLLIIAIAAASLVGVSATITWGYRFVATSKGYFELLRGARPSDPAEDRLWLWAKAGWYAWIVLIACIGIFAIAGSLGLFQ